MASGIVAALIAVLTLGFEEGMRRFYPSKATWLGLRSKHGRRAVRAMRERMDHAAENRLTRALATLLVGLVIIWVASASLLDKRWQEVVLDVLPTALVGIAMMRTSSTLRRIAERMKDYERDLGEDPDRDYGTGDGGPAAIAL
ncbi:MAG TPA: hypothetical protein VNP73_03905 [Actinomycetota bacterium]|nr:hypothetical protein [Actinomycetota bacterium]